PTATVQYQLIVYPSTADGLKHDDKTYEPNNTLHTAAPIALATEIASTINVTDDNIDWFQVPIDAAISYTVTLSNTCAAGVIYISAQVDDVALITGNVYLNPNTS